MKNLPLTVALCLLAVLLPGCQTTASAPGAVQKTWDAGRFVVPARASTTGYACSGPIERRFTDCISKIDRSRKRPVVIYMHGCSGLNSGNMTPFDRRLITVAPDSLARPGRAVNCKADANKQSIMAMRFSEVEYVLQMLLNQDWVDREKIILAGFSEGGSTAALYPGNGFAGRIILGWVCNSGNSWWRGIRGPKDTPVLAVVGSEDPYHQSPDKRGTHCGMVFYGRPDSESLVLENMRHNIVNDYRTIAAIEAFLQRIDAL